MKRPYFYFQSDGTIVFLNPDSINQSINTDLYSAIRRRRI